MAVYNESTFEVKQFTGLDLSPNSESGADNTLEVCNNFSVGDDGSLIKRLGITQRPDPSNYFGAGAIPIGIFDQIGITSHYIIIAASAKTFYVDTNDVYTEILFSNRDVSTGSNSAPASSCIQLNNVLYLTLNTSSLKGVWKWTGTGVAVSVAGSPNIDGISVFKEFLFGFSKVVGQESRIWYTNSITTSDLWPSDNYRDIQPGDGDYVTCLLPFKDRIVIFKNNSLWQLFLSGSDETWVHKLFHPSLGTFNAFSAEVYKNNYYFIHNTGVYSCDGVTITELSVPIRSIFKTLRTNGYISIVGSTLYIGGVIVSTILMYKLDSAIKAWTTSSSTIIGDVNNIIPARIQGTSPTTLDASAKAYDSNKIYMGANNGVYTLLLSDPLSATYVDTKADGTTVPITSTLVTKIFNIGRMSRLKRNKYSYLYCVGKGAKVTYSYIQDNDPIVGSLVVGANNETEIYRIQGAQYFRGLQLKIVESSDKPFLFFGFSFVLMLQRQAVNSVVGQ